MAVTRDEKIRLKLRQDLETIYRAGLAAVNPATAIRAKLTRSGNTLTIENTIIDLQEFERIYLISFGKAAAQMAQSLEQILAERLTTGIAIVPRTSGQVYASPKIRVLEAGHPIPDEGSVAAARAALELARRATADDLVLVAISGGGSALLALPPGGITLAEKQKTTELLLRSGATIQELNTVRKHISAIKGGQLARAIAPARFINLILSDVVGDHAEFIASGPTMPDSTTFVAALEICERYGLNASLPESVHARLKQGEIGEIEETLKPGDAIFRAGRTHFVGSNAVALAACREAAEKAGYHTLVLTSALQGEARETAKLYPAVAHEILHRGSPVATPACILAGGETTVTVRGPGKGGRNQEGVLATVAGLARLPCTVFAALGTDGIDGPTDAAGAVADHTTLSRANACGLDWREALARNDAYHFFAKLDDLLIIGPTGTNVMDLHILLVDRC